MVVAEVRDHTKVRAEHYLLMGRMPPNHKAQKLDATDWRQKDRQRKREREKEKHIFIDERKPLRLKNSNTVNPSCRRVNNTFALLAQNPGRDTKQLRPKDTPYIYLTFGLQMASCCGRLTNLQLLKKKYRLPAQMERRL